MKIVFASDHAGFELKNLLLKSVSDEGYEVEDLGAHEYNPEDDYPDYVAKAARYVSENPEEYRAVVLGGSGQGEAIVANRFDRVRAVVYAGPCIAKDGTDMSTLTREHNDANVFSLGARFLTFEEADAALKTWLRTPFSQEERHKRRIEKIETVTKSTN